MILIVMGPSTLGLMQVPRKGMQRCVYLHILLQATFLGGGLPQTAWNLRTENVRLLYQGDMGCPRKQRGGFGSVKSEGSRL